MESKQKEKVPEPDWHRQKEKNNFMLDQLVESNSHTRENARRGGFLLSTFVVVCSIFLSGILWSLFAKDLKMGGGDLEISTLVAPLPMIENAPPPAPKMVKPEPSQKAVTETTRQSNMERVDEAKLVPKDVSVTPNNQKARPVGKFFISDGPEFDKQAIASTNFGRDNNNIGTGITSDIETPLIDNTKTIKPPPLLEKKESPKIPIELKKSLGVINGIATNLVKPPYPPIAQAVRAAGAVNVQVTIDEKGNVISANAVSGHPLLRQAAETAARASKFNPTLLSNQPVKVTGLIVYKFTTQ